MVSKDMIGKVSASVRGEEGWPLAPKGSSLRPQHADVGCWRWMDRMGKTHNRFV